MVFSDPAFLFLFLPFALLVGQMALAAGMHAPVFLGLSLVFFYWSSGWYTLLLIASMLINYIGGILLDRRRDPLVLAVAIAGNLALLGYFKYAYFGLGVVDYLGSSRLEAFARSIVLPIGISFYTFQGISYLVDIWRREIRHEPCFTLFAAYLSFFPQLIAGPIVRYAQVANDFRRPANSVDMFAAGASRFTVGLAKKVLVADMVAPIADAAFATAPGELSMAGAWLGAIAYSIQIYFDFSGYSDMAIGLGMMFGIRFPENFRHPYAASTITEFWRRWHISLSTWFRDYVYIPLGGNRRGAWRTYANLLIVFLTVGLWHGAAWTFVFWGLWHGAFLIAERIAFAGKAAGMQSATLRILYFFPATIVGWVLFRSDSMPAFLHYAVAMANPFAGGGFGLSGKLTGALGPNEIAVLALACFAILFQGRARPLGVVLGDPDASRALQMARIGFVAVGLVCAMYLLQREFSPFLYFRF